MGCAASERILVHLFVKRKFTAQTDRESGGGRGEWRMGEEKGIRGNRERREWNKKKEDESNDKEEGAGREARKDNVREGRETESIYIYEYIIII